MLADIQNKVENVSNNMLKNTTNISNIKKYVLKKCLKPKPKPKHKPYTTLRC